MIASKRPALLIMSPVCKSWCKATDFAAKSPSQMIKLTAARAVQTVLMNKIADLVGLVMSYDGHVLIENPTHSKFWKQEFMENIRAYVSEIHTPREFLLNRCRVDGIHFKQYKFFTSLPNEYTDHMEMTCDHHFKHPPCLGRDANGRSVTAASGIYTKSMVFCLVGIVALMVGPHASLREVHSLQTISDLHHKAETALNESHNVDRCPDFEDATTEAYLRGVCPPLKHECNHINLHLPVVQPAMTNGSTDSALNTPGLRKLGRGGHATSG